MKWHEMSVIQKLELIHNAWRELNIYNIMFIPHIPNNEETDLPVACDGTINIELRIVAGDKGISESTNISYRAIHPDNKKYMKHILKTMALNMAKSYFNIPKEI